MPRMTAFVRIRPFAVEEGLRSGDPELDEALALARAPLPPDPGDPFGRSESDSPAGEPAGDAEPAPETERPSRAAVDGYTRRGRQAADSVMELAARLGVEPHAERPESLAAVATPDGWYAFEDIAVAMLERLDRAA